MSGKVVTLRTSLAWYEVLLSLVVGVLGYASGARWSALLCALGTGIAIGVWRAVRLLGEILDLTQAAVLDDEAAD